MDPNNGLYTDLDSFTCTSNCNTTINGFSDNCSTLPPLNNFKYQPTNLLTNNYQQPVQTIHDQQHSNSTKASSALPQTQININNCNNNIFFPHDDGIFDANTSASCASATSNSSGNTNNQKSSFIGHVRKELGASGSGGENINPLKNVYFNINNINTNIVNNIQNPTNFVNGTGDIFGGNQYHQINKNGETIINFTNNNLNSSGSSMPTDTVTATSQNYYGYQSNASGQGLQTAYESTLQSQNNAFLDPSLSASKTSMGTSGSGHYHHPNHGSLNQSMTNGAYLPGNASTIPSEHPSTVDPFNEYQEPLSTAKILTNFESKNPLKYQTANRSSGYYKPPNEYASQQYAQVVNHLSPHSYHNLYSNGSGLGPQAISKVPSAQHYEPYPRITRNPSSHYTSQHYTTIPSQHSIDEHNASRLNYSRPSAVPVHAPVPYTHSLPHPPNNYGNYIGNGYNMVPYPTYSQMPGPPSPYGSQMLRNESCSKSSTNFNKTGAVATLSPVEHNSYSHPHGATNYSAPKKDFYTENHYFPHPYFEDSVNSALNSCAKKTSSRPKVSADMYNPSVAATLYPDHHSMSHHPQSGSAMRNAGYQPMSKHYSSGNPYPMPTSSCDLAGPYHNFNYRYKSNEHQMIQKMNPVMSSKQFKSYGHFEPLAHPYGPHPQYHTMQAKHPEKLKISIDLEEQINSSKIPKLREAPHHPSYGFDPHHHYYHQYHPMPSRSIVDNDPKNSITNINLSLRDFLSTWNEIDEDEDGVEKRPILESLSENVERPIMREYNPMFVQKATDSFISATNVPSNSTDKSRLSELENGIINEGTEKLYVLESIDVPLSELNKYKHLSVINKLPENVVINDKELYADVESSMKLIEEIELPREKLYKSEFELEFEACQERKISKPLDEPPAMKFEKMTEERSVEREEKPEAKKPEAVDEKPMEKKKSPKEKSQKMKSEKVTKIRQTVLKKEKVFKASKDVNKVRSTKRLKKYSLNQQDSSVKSLRSICVDFVNTSAYRNYAREQYSIITKFSKMKILQDFKKKFNFDGMKKANAAINQKLNHSVRINSLSEICGKLLNDKSRLLDLDDEDDVFENIDSEHCDDEVPMLQDESRQDLAENGDEYLYTPLSLKELCEAFIYSNRQYFLIEEVSNVPKLQDLCKSILSETNIFINIDELNDETVEEALESNEIVDNAEPIYIVEESSGNVGELFESENLNSFEKSEILRKIQRVAGIEDDDEIIRAIGALHRDDDDDESIINNNSHSVSNKNISYANENFPDANGFATSDELKFDSEMSFMSYMDDDLMHSVQYEEIISGNEKGGNARKIVEILRYKYLNRSDIRQASKTITGILKKSLSYQRTHRFCNAKRRQQIDVLKQQARADFLKLRESKSCDKINSDETSSGGERSSRERELSTLNQREYDYEESQQYAKDDTKAQSPQATRFNLQPIVDVSPDTNLFDDLVEAETETNFLKLPSVLPSINEYKIDRKSSSRCDVRESSELKNRRLNFEESLLSIDKNYGKLNVPVIDEKHHEVSSKKRDSRERRGSSSSSRHHSRRHDDRYYDDREKRRHHSSRNEHRHSSSRSRRSRSHVRDNGSRKSLHNSSRHNFYKKDQMKHSEAKRLVIPSYKLYDKDLDVKLKIMPFVRIEREEKVDEMVKNHN